MERELHLPAITSAQAKKNMEKTFTKLLEYTAESEPNIFKPGRVAKYNVPDVINNGQYAYRKMKGQLIQVEGDDEFEGIDLGLDDLMETVDESDFM